MASLVRYDKGLVWDWSGKEWGDIRNGDDWLLAYLPYNDEPLRMTAISPTVIDSQSGEDLLKIAIRKVKK